MIQEANIRALAGADKVTTDKVFDMVAQAAPEGHDSDGIYDLRECCILLWFRAIYLDGCKEIGIDGSDPAGCPI